jgi:hypothetical protein
LCHLCEHAGATGLDSLDLSCGPRGSGEAGRQVAAVEELSGCGLDRAERLSGLAANEAAVLAGGDLAVQRTVLRGLLSVGSERLGEVGGRSSGVSVRSVVNLCASVRRGDRRSLDVRLRTAGDRSLAEEADHGLTSEEGACGVHFGVCGCEVYGLTCRSRVIRVESEVRVVAGSWKLWSWACRDRRFRLW